MQDDLKIFIPINEVNYKDLYDWSDPTQTCRAISTVVKPPAGLLRQSSKTGSLVKCNEQKIALFRHGKNVYAINEKCPHAGGPLHLGDIEEVADSICVRCPWHSWKFDLNTGKVKMPKGQDRAAKVYPVSVSEDGQLSIGFDEFDAKYFTGEIDF